jgi:predicted metal-dependent hydrolase
MRSKRIAKSRVVGSTVLVWFEFINPFTKNKTELVETLQLGSRSVAVHLVRHPRARRYLLRLRADGTARVTIPRRGTATEARRFVERNRAWLEEQFQRLQVQPGRPTSWAAGSEFLFRGEPVRIETGENGEIRFGSETVQGIGSADDLRPAIEKYLRGLASRELPVRVMEYATQHELPVKRVTVRNQRSRWGSCSRRGTISLNWRLIQAPGFVRDYIILHELAHLRHMNHSRRYWAEVERLCPGYLEAERWLKRHSALLK